MTFCLMRVNKILKYRAPNLALLGVLARETLINCAMMMVILTGVTSSASAFELKPFKDRLFAYPNTLKSEDNGNYRIVDYKELRDINERDDVPVKRVNKRYIDMAGRRASKKSNVLTDYGRANYYYAGKSKSPTILTIYIHGSRGNGKQGMNDVSFGGNFNRIKMLMLKNNGLYLSPDAEAFGPKVERKIIAIINKHNGGQAGRRIILACGSSGGELCHRLSNNSELAPHIAGIAFLGSYGSDDYLTSLAVRAGVPTFIGHGSRDGVIPIAKMESFYAQLRQTGSPVQMVRFETGTHGTPIRMVDWRQTINWMLAN